MQWSIRTKFFIVLSSLLLTVVTSYLVLADKIFREDREVLVFDTNRSTTQQFVNELDNSVRRIINKMELLTELLQSTSNPSKQESALANSIFKKDSHLLAFQILGPQKKIRELISSPRLKQIDLNVSDLSNENILPTQIDFKSDQVIVENRSTPRSILYLIRVPIVIKGSRSKPSLYAQALVDGRAWVDLFRNSQTFAISFAVTPSGQVFLHPDTSQVLSKRNLEDVEIIRQAQATHPIIQQIEFTMDGTQYFGVFRKTSLGSLTVVSMVSKDTVRQASHLLFEKTIVLSMIIMTAVLLISLFFAGSLSTPLLSLVEATRQIAQGNFDTPISVQTHDEIGALAAAFAKMVRDLKSSRALLEEYNRGLEQKVQQRTQELEDKNAALRQQQDVMLKSVRMAAVGEIAGQAAHEVLNPLTGTISSLENMIFQLGKMTDSSAAPLMTFKNILEAWEKAYNAGGLESFFNDLAHPSEILKGKPLLEEDIQNLRLIFNQLNTLVKTFGVNLTIVLQESHRIGRIVDRMRGIDLMENSSSRIEIDTLIRDCLRASEDILHQSNIRVEREFALLGNLVHADKDEMWQVFSNLIKNSSDAILDRISNNAHMGGILPEGGVIRISTRMRGDQAIITVWDNGAGIEKENRERIFDTYFSTKGNAGTGYGLSICRRFIRNCGGEIALKNSEPGKYSEFELVIPIATNKSENRNKNAHS